MIAEKKITIIGSGWLGKALGQELHSKGHKIVLTTRSEEKKAALQREGFDTKIVDLPQIIPQEDIKETDILFINITPGLRRDKDGKSHLHQLQSLVEVVENPSAKKVIYISSTSIYASKNTEVDEEDADINHPLYKAEQLLKDNFPNLIIIRPGGLIGKDRVIVNHFEGRENLKNGYERINFIFKDDIVALSEIAIRENIPSGAYNAVADNHPLKKDFYPFWCKKLGLKKPTFDLAHQSPFKVISNEKIKRVFDYKFQFPDPMNFPLND